MSYGDRETSGYGGQPVEGYRFVQGESLWLYTSADQEITLPIGTFEPATIARSSLIQTKEDSSDNITVTVPVTCPVAALFVGDVPSQPVWFTLYRAHRGDESETITMFAGKITSASFRESEVTLSATSIASAILRNVPLLQMQTPCNHVLFSAECGADPVVSRDAITITTVDGRTVTSSDFSAREDGWYTAGRLVLDDETRFIVDHVGSTITLLSPLPGLASLDECWAYWGCDHLEATCIDKFYQLAHHLGWKRLPAKNPFKSRLDTPYPERHLWG